MSANSHYGFRLGIGWRPETAWLLSRRSDVTFSEVVAENIFARSERGIDLPKPLPELVAQGKAVIPHGISLSLGSAQPPDLKHVSRLARLAEALQAPYVSEHVCFTRAGDINVGHLTAVPHTEAMLARLVENIRKTQQLLPVPLVLENIASLFRWPGDEVTEADFMYRLVEETGAYFLLDVANLYANAVNHELDLEHYLDRAPLHRVAYLHVAGGRQWGGLYHDTHANLVPSPVLALLEQVMARGVRAPVLLEYDDHYPRAGVLDQQLDAIATAARRGIEKAAASAAPKRSGGAWVETHFSTPSAFTSLAVQQRDLAAALVGKSEAPTGFDSARIGASRRALRCKKAREEERRRQRQGLR